MAAVKDKYLEPFLIVTIRFLSRYFLLSFAGYTNLFHHIMALLCATLIIKINRTKYLDIQS